MNSSNCFSTINPATGEQIETFPFFTAAANGSRARSRREDLQVLSESRACINVHNYSHSSPQRYGRTRHNWRK